MLESALDRAGIQHTAFKYSESTAQFQAIHEQAASGTIEIAKLQQAFQNIYQTMDAIDDFKLKALASMQTTVETLGSEVEKSRSYLDRVRRREAGNTFEASSAGVSL